nr:MAG TPA: Protease NS2-3 C Virus, NS2 domain [Bacteriophage sp.]
MLITNCDAKVRIIFDITKYLLVKKVNTLFIIKYFKKTKYFIF